ncbi:FtsQ-type POTRA domain-containing protein [Leucobacter sp. OH2974_COT-288]|nr:FtsQ-type POTRA domain-containing protein [Leucobacter sp. OH2974_COT-288]
MMKRPVGFDTAAQENYHAEARRPVGEAAAGESAPAVVSAAVPTVSPPATKSPRFSARIAQAVADANDFRPVGSAETPQAAPGQEPDAAAAELGAENLAAAPHAEPAADLAAVSPAETLAVTPRGEDLAAAQKQQKLRIKQARRRLARAERAKTRTFRFWQRQLTVSRRRQLRRLGVGAMMIALLGVLVGIAVLTPALAVKEIQVSGGSDELNSTVSEALYPLQGKPLAFVKDAEVHEALRQFALIQDYDVQRVPPGQLIVQLTERTAVLALPRGEKFTIVDAAGVELMVAEVLPDGLPLAVGDGISKVGTKQFFAAAAVLRDIPAELRSQVAEVSAAGAQSIELKMRDGVVVRWGGAQDTPLKAVIYSKMAAALADQEISVIDVSATEAPVYQ